MRAAAAAAVAGRALVEGGGGRAQACAAAGILVVQFAERRDVDLLCALAAADAVSDCAPGTLAGARLGAAARVAVAPSRGRALVEFSGVAVRRRPRGAGGGCAGGVPAHQLLLRGPSTGILEQQATSVARCARAVHAWVTDCARAGGGGGGGAAVDASDGLMLRVVSAGGASELLLASLHVSSCTAAAAAAAHTVMHSPIAAAAAAAAAAPVARAAMGECKTVSAPGAAGSGPRAAAAADAAAAVLDALLAVPAALLASCGPAPRLVAAPLSAPPGVVVPWRGDPRAGSWSRGPERSGGGRSHALLLLLLARLAECGGAGCVGLDLTMAPPAPERGGGGGGGRDARGADAGVGLRDLAARGAVESPWAAARVFAAAAEFVASVARVDRVCSAVRRARGEGGEDPSSDSS